MGVCLFSKVMMLPSVGWLVEMGSARPAGVAITSNSKAQVPFSVEVKVVIETTIVITSGSSNTQ